MNCARLLIDLGIKKCTSLLIGKYKTHLYFKKPTEGGNSSVSIYRYQTVLKWVGLKKSRYIRTMLHERSKGAENNKRTFT